MSQHNIFCNTQLLQLLAAGYVSSFIDKSDNNFQVGQTITVHETLVGSKEPTGRSRIVVIRNVGLNIKGLAKGYCVVSFSGFK